MNEGFEYVPDGSVTTPGGFQAGAVHVGVRRDWTKLDLGLLYSESPCTAAAMWTKNRLKAAPVLISQKHLADGRAQAIVANAGCANAATGKQGLENAVALAQLAAKRLGIDPHDVVVASTGVIGAQLPMDRIASGIEKITLSHDGGIDFAAAIMTTDTVRKHVAVKTPDWAIGGVVKGVGMIHPDMATMLCFLTTDAAAGQPFLAAALRQAVDHSFHMIDVDSDTSTNDTAVLLANGAAGNDPLSKGHPEAPLFTEALTAVCTRLAKAMVADAEGASKIIECRVSGAASPADARKAAREVVRSLGVKTAIYGQDPNWGRILAAIGNSGCEFDPDRTQLVMAGPDGSEVAIYDGAPLAYDRAAAKACLAPREVSVRVDLRMGAGEATGWGSDLTEDYVRLNSLYTT
jgi:glutamate N-acetyltransferase/amino-acid N-acetyltransferase